MSEESANSASEQRLSATRHIMASPGDVFAVLRDPDGHVAIDSSGMLQSASGESVSAVDDSFVVHMDREALGDYPELGTYEVTIRITAYDEPRLIEWTVESTVFNIGHRYGYELAESGDGTDATAYYDWSTAAPEWQSIFPVIPATALKATLGILDRTVRRGYVRGD